MSLFRSTTTTRGVHLGLESLEAREMMAGDSFMFSVYKDSLIISTGSLSDHGIKPLPEQLHAEVVNEGSGVRVTAQFRREGSNDWEKPHTAFFSSSDFSKIEFRGESGDDQFINKTSFNSKALGGKGNDILVGGSGVDYLYGGDAKDILIGGKGNDFLFGEKGNDLLSGGIGDDLYGYGAGENHQWKFQGNDTIKDVNGRNMLDFRFLGGRANVDIAKTGQQVVNNKHLSLNLASENAIAIVYGSEYNDILRGNALDNELWGMDGKDILEGRQGDDHLIGDSMTEVKSGKNQNDFFIFKGDGLGTDSIWDTSGSNTLVLRDRTGGNKIDLAVTAKQVVENGELALILQSDQTIQHVIGSEFDDVIKGNSLNNRIDGAGGDDRIEGRKGNDRLLGGNGKNYFLFNGGQLGRDTIQGSAGVNILDFRTRKSGIELDLATTGWQEVQKAHIQLRLYDKNVIDHVVGTDYDDTIKGNQLANKIVGRKGNDSLYGRQGNDQISGNQGLDGLFGGKGADLLGGGADADRFLFQKGDKIVGRESKDAVLNFIDGQNPRWKDSEIEDLDTGFRSLHMRAGNTRLLKRADGGLIRFYRSSSEGNTLAVNHENGSIRFYDIAFTNTALPAYTTTVHEMAHNWDDGGKEGPLLNQFKSISGWRRVSGKWVHHPDATFSTSNGDYAKKSPYEDIAESWETYFYGTQAEKRHIQAKINAIDKFFKSIES